MKYPKLTKNAKGQECTIQLYPYCNGNPETVVFCHAPSSDKGMGIKSPDWWGAFGCSACHDIVDHRNRIAFEIGERIVYEQFHDAIYRTLKIQIADGKIKI